MRGRAARLGSVYMGGGTPSLMTAEQVARLLGATDDAFGIADGAEITLEVNPGPDDRGDVAGFAAAGVNRISIGAQSMDAGELKRLGRRQSAVDVATAVHDARAAGLDNVSIDLLYDVPGQTLSSWRDSLAVTLALEPDHVSAYALTLDPNDAADDHLPPRGGATRWRALARTAQDEDRAADMYELLDTELDRAGLAWYEISNFARRGHVSRHNLVYWRSEPWEAVGPGAHRFDGTTRSWNLARLDGYLSALAARRLPPTSSVTTTSAERGAERAILRLRTAAGVAPTELGHELAWAFSSDLLEQAGGGNVRLTVKGRLLSNELFARLA